MTGTVDLPVLYLEDRDEGTWSYVITQPALQGGPFATLGEAQAGAVRGMVAAFRDAGVVDRPHATIGHLRVTVAVAPAMVTASAA